MEGNFNYTIDGVERKFFFGNYALEKVLHHFNIGVDELQNIPKSREMEFVRVWMYHAACYPILKDGGIPDFKEIDSYGWVDASNSHILVAVTEAVQKSLGMSNAVDEKKSQKQ
jgi:hypothetical protein